MIVSFKDGPADGHELAFIGKRPSFVLLKQFPESPMQDGWTVVGADFDDDWPGQHRYELRSWIEDVRTGEEHATYVYVRR